MSMKAKSKYPAWWSDLAALVLERTPPPCIHPDRCHHYYRCASQQLACSTFDRYVTEGGEYDPDTFRLPGTFLYRRMMKA